MSDTNLTPQSQPINVILVHGALVDASGWRAVYDRLSKDGFYVSAVNHPLTSREADLATVRRVLALQTGPVVLVGHSYGGVLITEAGLDPKVKALVYVAALQPDSGESPLALLQSKPAMSQATRFTEDGYAYVDPFHFHEDFAADLSAEDAGFMAHSQVFVAVECLQTAVSTAAWHQKPTFAIVAKNDRTLSPELQRFMYQRAGSKVTELESSHAVYISHHVAVAEVIKSAGRDTCT